MALAMIILPIATLQAQGNGFKADVQLLTQGEIRDGGVVDYSEEDDAPTRQDRSGFIVGRVRLNLNYQKDALSLKVSPQYSGIWGQKGFGSFHLFEAWAQYKLPVGIFAQIGRQALSYDDERIIGPNDWAMAAVSHDVLKLGYEGHGHKAHFLLAFNQNPENVSGGTVYVDGAQPYKTMQTLWYHYDIPGIGLGASLLAMNLGVQADVAMKENPHVNYQQMLGTHITFKPSWGDFSASYYHQLGKNENGIPIDAFMAATKATVTPSDIWRFTAGFDYLSGDPYFVIPKEGQIGLIIHDKIRGFTSLYGSHHKFYGMMDFFYVSTYYNGFTPGLQNAYGGASVKLWNKLTLEALYHYMATATQLEGLGKTLGHCLETTASLPINQIITLRAGFSYMTGTETMKALKRTNQYGHLSWTYLTLLINPGF